MQGRHAKKKLGTSTGTVLTVAVGAAAAVPASVLLSSHPSLPGAQPVTQLAAASTPMDHLTPAAPHARVSLSAVTVQSGDTLSGISSVLCGTSADYPHLAAGNHITDPDVIEVGQVVNRTCDAYVPRHAAPAASAPRASTPVQQDAATSSAPAAPRIYGDYSCGALESLWESAGGSAALAPTMAGIAMAESGGNPSAVSPTDDFGLWQDHADPAALSPSVSAEHSVTIEESQGLAAWTTYRTGAYAGRC
jgi:hypothetical protein